LTASTAWYAEATAMPPPLVRLNWGDVDAKCGLDTATRMCSSDL
jgi:hypothetical protein